MRGNSTLNRSAWHCRPPKLSPEADEEQLAGRGDDIGHELTGRVMYDYTEDVTFSVMGSYFDPDDAFRANEDDEAYLITSSVSVEF